MTRVGLVLGAGGVVGQAYQAGVLSALATELGWDPRSADVIVGTSAGSVTGAALRLGVPAGDLCCFGLDRAPSPEGAPLLEALRANLPELPAFDPSAVVRPWRLPPAAAVARAARRPWAFRPTVAAVTMLPAGTFDLVPYTSVLDEVGVGRFPRGLWICAARRRDGQRVVFGRPGAPPAPLGRAVAASCAIPAWFRPVRIAGTSYIDGGVHSPTNADVLRREPLDLVVVVSSMSAAHGRAPTPDAPLRFAAHRRLEREARRLQEAGIEVVRIEPGRRALAAMGVNAMADDRSDRVIEAAYDETARYLARPGVATKLAGLRPVRFAA